MDNTAKSDIVIINTSVKIPIKLLFWLLMFALINVKFHLNSPDFLS